MTASGPRSISRPERYSNTGRSAECGSGREAEPEVLELVLDLDQRGLAEVLAGEQRLLAGLAQLADGGDAQRLQRGAAAHGEVEVRDGLVAHVVRVVRPDLARARRRRDGLVLVRHGDVL